MLVIVLTPIALLSIYTNQVSASDLERITNEPENSSNWEAELAAILILYLLGWLTAWGMQRTLRSTRMALARFGHIAPRFIGLGVGVRLLLVAAFAILYSTFFMQVVYPTIPAQFGGGQPQRVSILFSPDASPSLKEIGMPLEPGKPDLSAPLELIHEANSIYVVRLPDERVMRIDKGLVSIVIPHAESKTGNETMP